MVVIGLVVSSYFFIESTQKYIMPIAVKLCMSEAKETANQVINSSVNKALEDSGINLSDVFHVGDESGVTMISTDTEVINTLCADISDYITNDMVNLKNDTVKIPYGATTGIGILANMGPPITFEIMPTGGVEVDYQTEFNSAGINQTNYKIWLTVNITVSLVNPIYNEDMIMTRKIMLVDTVINGEVPDYYYKAVQ